MLSVPWKFRNDCGPELDCAAAAPNHPEYPAAHGCVTGAVANRLKGFFGNAHLTFVVSSSVTGTTHRFTNIHDLENEVEWARIYADFHYHHSLVHGFVLGHKVASKFSQNPFNQLINPLPI
jgi:hypothetical protein